MEKLTYTRRPVIYVAGPFRGPNDYARKLHRDAAEALAFEIWSLGAVALTPHLNTAHFDGALPDPIWLDGDLELLRRCDAICMARNWRQSQGASLELTYATAWGLPVWYQSTQREDVAVIGRAPEFQAWIVEWQVAHVDAAVEAGA